jgi:hypothetical protein
MAERIARIGNNLINRADRPDIPTDWPGRVGDVLLFHDGTQRPHAALREGIRSVEVVGRDEPNDEDYEGQFSYSIHTYGSGAVHLGYQSHTSIGRPPLTRSIWGKTSEGDLIHNVKIVADPLEHTVWGKEESLVERDDRRLGLRPKTAYERYLARPVVIQAATRILRIVGSELRKHEINPQTAIDRHERLVAAEVPMEVWFERIAEAVESLGPPNLAVRILPNPANTHIPNDPNKM